MAENKEQLMNRLEQAFEDKYRANHRDPMVAEELRHFIMGWNAALSSPPSVGEPSTDGAKPAGDGLMDIAMQCMNEGPDLPQKPYVILDEAGVKRFAAALAAAPESTSTKCNSQGAPKQHFCEKPVAAGLRDEAYAQIDRFLRNNLDDTDYADYSQALDLIFLAPSDGSRPADSGEPES